MKRFLLVGMVGFVGLVPIACTDVEARNSGDQVATQVGATRRVLSEARGLAHDYGTQHLGHYLDLRLNDLRKAGLELPDEISMKVRTDHTSYCIEVTNKALPSIHEWREATATSRAPGPDPSDRCVR